MHRFLLHSKVHRAKVTEVSLHYEGSISIDEALLKAAGILPFERVDVFDVENGARFQTYVIPVSEGSGTVCVNGAAARLVQPGDTVIMVSFVVLDEAEVGNHVPRVVLVDPANKVVSVETGSLVVEPDPVRVGVRPRTPRDMDDWMDSATDELPLYSRTLITRLREFRATRDLAGLPSTLTREAAAHIERIESENLLLTRALDQTPLARDPSAI